jgi:hypothetical protein
VSVSVKAFLCHFYGVMLIKVASRNEQAVLVLPGVSSDFRRI